MNQQWEKLPEGSRKIVRRLILLLGQGFTGRIQIDCGQGGVRNMSEQRSYQPGDLSAEGEDKG